MALCVDLITYFTTFVISFMIVMLEKAVEWCWCNIATKYKYKRQLNYHDDVFQHPNLAHPTSIISKCHLQVVTTLLAIVIVFAVKCLSLPMPVGLLISSVYPESSVNIFSWDVSVCISGCTGISVYLKRWQQLCSIAQRPLAGVDIDCMDTW